MEFIVSLKTPNGDVRTAYPESMKDRALAHFEAYLSEGKPCTIGAEFSTTEERNAFLGVESV